MLTDEFVVELLSQTQTTLTCVYDSNIINKNIINKKSFLLIWICNVFIVLGRAKYNSNTKRSSQYFWSSKFHGTLQYLYCYLDF